MINIAKQRILKSNLTMKEKMRIMEDLNSVQDDNYDESILHKKPITVDSIFEGFTYSITKYEIILTPKKGKIKIRVKRPIVFLF